MDDAREIFMRERGRPKGSEEAAVPVSTTEASPPNSAWRPKETIDPGWEIIRANFASQRESEERSRQLVKPEPAEEVVPMEALTAALADARRRHEVAVAAKPVAVQQLEDAVRKRREADAALREASPADEKTYSKAVLAKSLSEATVTDLEQRAANAEYEEGAAAKALKKATFEEAKGRAYALLDQAATKARECDAFAREKDLEVVAKYQERQPLLDAMESAVKEASRVGEELGMGFSERRFSADVERAGARSRIERRNW